MSTPRLSEEQLAALESRAALTGDLLTQRYTIVADLCADLRSARAERDTAWSKLDLVNRELGAVAASLRDRLEKAREAWGRCEVRHHFRCGLDDAPYGFMDGLALDDPRCDCGAREVCEALREAP